MQNHGWKSLHCHEQRSNERFGGLILERVCCIVQVFIFYGCLLNCEQIMVQSAFLINIMLLKSQFDQIYRKYDTSIEDITAIVMPTLFLSSPPSK
jgi:hypothetical protein